MDLTEQKMHEAYLARVKAEVLYIYFKTAACVAVFGLASTLTWKVLS